MLVETFPLGPLGSNLYVINKNGRYLIVDPSVSPARINMSDKLSDVEAVFVTHGHFDHINKIDDWKDVPVYMHPDDFDALKDPHVSLVSEFGLSDSFVTTPSDINSINGKVFLGDESNGVKVEIIHTPGHCPGQCVIAITDLESSDKVMFTGDMLFAGAIGRFDFYRSSAKDMMSSIKKLQCIKEDYVVYPGHGPSSTLFIEQRTNPYFN